MRLLRPAALAVILLSTMSGCDYVRLLRPSVLKQLDPQMVRLVNELPNVDDANERLIGQLFARGGLDHAKVGRDGVMRIDVRVPSGEFLWRPALIVMERPGELEIDVYNEDDFSHHAMVIPSIGDMQGLMLPVHTHGKTRIRIDSPGLYWFGCPVANHATRGMLGFVLVGGEVPPEAKLDRPRQKRP